MKTRITLLTATLFLSLGIFAQAPQAINYQAVARDGTGNPMISSPLTIVFDVRQGSSSGTIVYSETQTPTTNQFGLFTVAIGGGIPNAPFVLSDFANINWGASTYHLQVTVNGDVMPATQLLSVPYALHANTATSGTPGVDGLDCWDLNGNGVQDVAEDINNDGFWDALDCKGDSGVTGPMGPTGAIGLTGATGPAGAAGPQGPSGTVGPQGPIGLTGATGTTGVAGPQGTIGLTGPTGAQGPIGTTGAIGPAGTVGPQGPIGLTGSTGAAGAQGPAGVAGPAGTVGPQGPIGLTGATGPAGTYTAGAGIDLTSNIITNLLPDQTVVLTGTGATTVTGTYPTFTINSVDNVNDADFDPNNEHNTNFWQDGTNLIITDGGGTLTVPLSTLTDNDWTTGLNVVYNLTDDVGIGIANPAYNFHVHESNAGTISYGSFTNVTTGSSISDGFIMGVDIAGDANLINREATNMNFYTNNLTRMTLDPSGNLGIGTTNPLNSLDVIHTATVSNNSAAHIGYVFNGTGLGINAGLHIETTNGNGSNNAWGVYSSTSGVSNAGAADIGVGGYAQGAGTGDHKGIDAGALGTSGNNYGGFFGATGSTVGTNYAVYGMASGSSTNNWAGYFASGNVYIQNNLGINTTSPISPLHVEGNTYINGTTQIGGTAALAATLKVFSGFGAGTAYFFDSGGQVSLSVLSSGNVTIGNTTSVGRFFIQDNDANTTGATGSFISVQNLANGTNTTAGIRFRTGGSTALNGDFHYKGAIFFEDGTGTNGEGDMIFAVNNVASSANVTTADAAMTINNLGNVGVGTTIPNSQLHINETTANPALRVQLNGGTQFIVANNGNIALNNNAAPAFKLHLSTNSAAKPTSNVWTVSSDIRLKKDIKPFKGGLSDILKINPIWFTYNGKAGMPEDTGVGVIAQELQKIAPYMVNTWTYVEGSEDEDNPRTDGAKTDYLGVDNGAMTYMLINAIKEQQKMIDELKKEVKELKNK